MHLNSGCMCFSSICMSFSPGFRWKELRGKLAIGITCNFINHHSAAEAQVAEISGVARIYNQKFFQDLLTEKGRILFYDPGLGLLSASTSTVGR